MLCERHEPNKVLPKLVDAARAAMSSCFVLQPERRRHAARPRMPITVASLAKLSGNADVHQLYVRVGTDGKVLYVEGYEDGTYADLMELREYSRVRMQTFNEGEGDSEPLQTPRTSSAPVPVPSSPVVSATTTGRQKFFPSFDPKSTIDNVSSLNTAIYNYFCQDLFFELNIRISVFV